MPDDGGQFFAYHRTGYVFAASPGHFLIKFLHHWIIPIRDNGRLIEDDSKIPVAIFVFTAVAIFAC